MPVRICGAESYDGDNGVKFRPLSEEGGALICFIVCIVATSILRRVKRL